MGNRVKGRVKKKSIKAASHSGMGSKRKLSRMGKKQKKDHSGIDATFIGRSACLRKLQISLKDFRRLCILKGIYPREPRGRAPGNKKGQVYYHVKDVRAIAHEPVLYKFREFSAFMKKVRRAAGRNEKDEAARMDNYAPTYTLHHLVRERYPRFVDAISDVDDALTLVYLFAALPSERRIKSRITNKAKSLAAAWSAYCATTSSVTKSFVSVKGVYFEANVQGSAVRWVVPHAFTQNMPDDVDYRVMLTFFEFYETLLGFVLYKLYNDIGVRYPLAVSSIERNNASSVLAANLRALSRETRDSKSMVSNAVAEAIEASKEEGTNAEETEGGDGGKKKLSKKSKALIKSVDVALNKIAGEDSDDGDDSDDEDDVDLSSPLKAALESVSNAEDQIGGAVADGDGSGTSLDEEATKRRRLFAGLTFFISREVPRGYLELVCLAFGGKVGWDDSDSPIAASDPSITHHIVDRPKLPSSFDALPKSREYVQPQWIFDCANFHFLLPCSRYAIGAALPPHLSPWVDDEEEGYKPAYAGEVEKLKNGEILDVQTTEVVGGAAESSADEGADAKETKDEDRSANDDTSDDDDDDVTDSEEEDDDVKADKMKKRRRDEDAETKELAKMMMSKKAARLYGRMQHGLEQKSKKIEDLQQRRKELEYTKEKKDGKTIVKQKVERLKKERRDVEKDYADTGGSMSKKKSRRSKN
mmetsp:Transcript_18148/g.51938  ORF Transcript_18148/g.51938 Transcript_18148/m.51938 type:complete len:701 (-) Transcript_18148:47-2149(-)